MNASRIIGAIAVVLFVVMGVCGVAIAQTQLDRIEQTVNNTNITVKEVGKILVGLRNYPKLMDGRYQIKQTASTTFPIVIDQPGSYVLTSNIAVTTVGVDAIQINTNSVTLDLNGHTITGLGHNYGIFAFNHYDITVKNGIVKNFQYGIYVENDSLHEGGGHRIEKIQASNNSVHGIFARYSTVTNCAASYNDGSGIITYHSIVTNSIASNNSGTGISITYGTVINSTAFNNGSGSGIVSTYGTVTNCTASNNGGSGGIYAEGSNVKGCNVRNNTLYGITMAQDNHNYIYGNSASGNGSGQINCPTGNTCVDNAVF